MRNVYTVKQVNAYVKGMFAQDFMLNRIYVKGEVSNVKYHTSGHIYFSLKDESGAIACVMFAGQRSGLSFRMQEGQQVVVLGSVSVYERDGKYQLYAKEVILDGAGLLYERFQQLKRELEEMGMFAPEYKRPIPMYARRIGVVTAPTGAAIRDIIHVATRRNPYVQIILYPALVQGEGAAKSIVRGIESLEKQNVDVMIVGRGGGSMEDLWAFNEEIVAKAVFHSSVPIISAVGHETDTTIIDYVADLRAPTPSAAAEIAVCEYQNITQSLKEYEWKYKRALLQKLQVDRLRYEKYRTRISYLGPENQLKSYRQRLIDLEEYIGRSMEGRILEQRRNLALYIEKFKGLSPLEKLNQGYAFVCNESGEPVRKIEDVKQNDKLQIFVSDGRIQAIVCGAQKEEYGD